MKTLEFKIYPTLAQSQTIDKWLDKLKWVWNTGLSLKLAGRQKYYREKEIGDQVIPDGVVLQWKWRKVVTEDKKGKSTEKWEKVRLVGTGVIRPKSGYPYCEIGQHLNIEDPDKYGQCEFYRSDKIPDFMADVPTKFKAGVIDSLKKSWKAYVTPKHPGRKPKFKGRNDKIKSLVNLNAGGKSKELKPERIPGSNNGYVQFPKLGKIKVKGLFDRYNWQEWGAARIVKEPSGYYLHVCVDVLNEPLPKSDKPVGIDPGLLSVITTDQGREVEPPKLFRKQQAKLRRLQRKASRQVKGGCNQKKTYRKIALHHEKIRRSRNAFNHKLSTKIVREYSGIVMEDIKIQNLNRKPKAKKREDGNGYEQNGAKRKAGLNKSFADSALGDLISKIETKCQDTDREFV
ncbi:MAG: type V CRISPR-associated protein C2c8, partial [Dolichospermum sp.]